MQKHNASHHKNRCNESFYWGVATAAHQTEGRQNNSWSEWEKTKASNSANEAKEKFSLLSKLGMQLDWNKYKTDASDPKNYLSSIANDFWNRYEEDIQIARGLKLNSFRISLEWSRIEPTEGEYSRDAIKQYRRIISFMKKSNIEPFITLWHFTFPIWAEDLGGFNSKIVRNRFNEFVGYIATEFSEVTYWFTINEPYVFSFRAYLTGDFPPGERNLLTFLRSTQNFTKVHNRTYKTIKRILPNSKVGYAKDQVEIIPSPNKAVNRLFSKTLGWFWNERFIMQTLKHTDFIGINFYLTLFINGFKNQPPTDTQHSDLGFPIQPESLYRQLLSHKKYNLPIFISENGIAASNDIQREEYLSTHIEAMDIAIKHGVDVRGYFHWTLIDNFEWDFGYWPKFGLVTTDSDNNRIIKNSALHYKKIIESHNTPNQSS